MKRFSEQLQKKSHTVKLTKAEQADLRDRIVSYMEYHPLPASMKTAPAPKTRAASAKSQILTDTFGQFAIPYQLLFKLGGVAAVFVLVFVPFMAERTVPGDTLYAVKVQFNEEVRGTLTWGSYEKVEWETTLLNRRIAEARLLADEGLLTEEVEAGVAAAVKVHSDNAKREIEVLRASDADEATIATIAFQSSLQVQSQAFGDEAAVPVTATGSARTGVLISQVIGESQATILAAPTSTVPAYDKLMARVEQNTTRVRDLRDSLEGATTEQDLADVTRRIEDIDRAIMVAIDLAADESTELDARIALTDVVARTQRLIVFMTELEVREEVTIEEVVPVVPTTDEMQIDRAKRITQLSNAINTINTALTTIADDAIAEKLTASIDNLRLAVTQLGVIDDYKTFVSVSNESQALATDALQMLEQQGYVAVDTQLPAAATSTATTTDELTIPTATSSDDGTSDLTTAPDLTAATSTQNTQTEVDESR